MKQPLAIVFYERIMPGSQLANRLRDLDYRVLVVTNPALLAATVQREMPLLLFADLATDGDVGGAIKKIKTDSATSHLPVIAFAPADQPDLLTAAQKAGASLVISETAVVNHLSQLLEQALNLE